MAKRKKKKTQSVSVPGNVRRAKGIIKKHTAKLKKLKERQEKELAKTNRELREVSSL